MSSVATSYFPFYAHSITVSNFFNFGFGGGGGDNISKKKNDDNPADVVIEIDQENPLKTTTTTTTSSSTGSASQQQQKQKQQQDLDLITDLPGLNYDPGFKQYSGYLTLVDDDDDDEEEGHHERNIFYWFVESQGNVSNDPLLFWTNGGPGCSGLLGLGIEHGPFYFDYHNGRQQQLLSPNPFSWNKLANILYVEIPVGVGFSYSTSTSSHTEKNYYKMFANDQHTAQDNFAVITKFLQRFPNLQSNDFYIASESYGGHYMPQLALEIIRDGQINFKGMMIGNPYVDSFTTTISQFQAWYSHGLLPLPLYKQYADNCHDRKKYHNRECLKYMVQMYKVVGKGINFYALDYPLCLEKEISASANIATTATTYRLRQIFGASEQSMKILNQTATTSFDSMHQDGNANPPFISDKKDHVRVCADHHFTKYLQRDDVISAIHARKTTNDSSSSPWSQCSDIVFQSYSQNDFESSQVPLYRDLIDIVITQQQEIKQKQKHDDYIPNNNNKDSNKYSNPTTASSPFHILIYSGDDDSVCSLACTQSWIWDLGIEPKQHSNWEPWFVHNQAAGYVTKFDLTTKSSVVRGAKDEPSSPSPSPSFTFVTVHGAGHEVPLYKPMEAFELLKRYLNHDW